MNNLMILLFSILFFTSCSTKEAKIKTEKNETKEKNYAIEEKVFNCIDIETGKEAELIIKYKSNWGESYKKAFFFLQIHEEKVKNCRELN